MSPQLKNNVADVSVLIPAYRSSETIIRALESVARQTVLPCEVIVVVDGSEDDTYSTAAAYKDKISGVTLNVFYQDHHGAGAARNRALAESSATYVAFLDADDEWLPEKLEHTLFHLNDGKYSLVSHNVRVKSGSDEHVVDCVRHFNPSAADHFVSIYRRGYISTSTVVAKRSSIIKAGGFDDSLPTAQDFDLWLSILKEPGAQLHIFDEPLTRNYITEGSITSNTTRRLNCCLWIALRYVPELEKRAGSTYLSLWFRIIAIHLEALTAYSNRRQYMKALMILFRLPVSIMTLSFKAFFGLKKI